MSIGPYYVYCTRGSLTIGSLFLSLSRSSHHGDWPCEKTTDKHPASDADGDSHLASTLVSESSQSIKVSALKSTKTHRKHVRLAPQRLRSAVIVSLVSDNVAGSPTTTIVLIHRLSLPETEDIYASLLRYQQQRRSFSPFSSPILITSMFGKQRQHHAFHRYHPLHLLRRGSLPSTDCFIFPYPYCFALP